MVYVILPLYNEQENAGSIIEGIRRELSGMPYKIIAINDGSTDNTLEVLNDLIGDDIIIDSHLMNMSIGVVLLTGLMRAFSDSKDDNDIIVVMEADQTSPANLLKGLISEIQKGNSAVIASRYQKGGGYKNFPFHRKIFSQGANFFLRKLFPIEGVRDYTIFLRAYHMSIFKTLIDYFSQHGLIQSSGFIANSEILIKISLFSKRIKEIPFVYDYGQRRGKSKMKIIHTIGEYFVFALYMKSLFKKMKSRQMCSYVR